MVAIPGVVLRRRRIMGRSAFDRRYCGRRAAGVAASQGHLNLAATVVAITIAGEIGGLIGNHIGSRWGRQLVERPGRHYDYRLKLLAKGERAYEQWGRLAV